MLLVSMSTSTDPSTGFSTASRLDCKEFPVDSEFLPAVSISTFTDPSDVVGDSTWDAPLFTRSETKLFKNFVSSWAVFFVVFL